MPREYRQVLAALTGTEEIWMAIAPYGAITCLPRAAGEQAMRSRTAPWLKAGDAPLAMYRKHLFAMSKVVTPDGNGRIVVPNKLCEMVGLGRSVNWIGENGWFELWDARRWDETWSNLDLAQLTDSFNAALADASLVGGYGEGEE